MTRFLISDLTMVDCLLGNWAYDYEHIKRLLYWNATRKTIFKNYRMESIQIKKTNLNALEYSISL